MTTSRRELREWRWLELVALSMFVVLALLAVLDGSWYFAGYATFGFVAWGSSAASSKEGRLGELARKIPLNGHAILAIWLAVVILGATVALLRIAGVL